MAFDKIIVFSETTSTIDTTGWKRPKGNTASYLSSRCRIKSANGIVVYVVPDGKVQRIFISFNVGKILSNDNIANHWCFNVARLENEIKNRIQSIISLKALNLPHLREWFVSLVEIHFDLVDTVENINEYYSIVQKLQISRYHKDQSYLHRGTQYFLSNRNLNDSNIIIKCYRKLKERQDNVPGFQLNSYYAPKSPIVLTPDDDVLRFELTFKRKKVKRSLKPKVYSSTGIINKSIYLDSLNDALFERVINFKYGYSQIERLIRLMGFDRSIPTRKELLNAINNSFKRKDSKLKARSVIDALNNVSNNKRKPKNYKEINRYKRRILNDLNLHYLYAKNNLPPITMERVMENLPDYIKQELKTYKNSSLAKDIMF